MKATVACSLKNIIFPCKINCNVIYLFQVRKTYRGISSFLFSSIKKLLEIKKRDANYNFFFIADMTAEKYAT